MRRLILLNGLAILAVVSNHAAHQGFLAMFWWTDRYIPGVAVPNYDQYGSLSYYGLIAMIKLTFFAIPSFLFVSGFFIAYTSRGKQTTLSWKVVRVRIANLLIPYLIWSLVFFGADFAQSCLDSCQPDTPLNYLQKLLTGGAVTTFWYVPLIIQFYLLSFFLVPLAEKRWKTAVLLGVFAQASAIMVTYLGIAGFAVPKGVAALFTTVYFPRDIVYFIVGIVVGFHFTSFRRWLARVKWALLVTWLVSIVFVLLEAELIFRLGGGTYYLGHIRGGYFTVPMTVYVISFIFTFLAFEHVALPWANVALQLGRRSYGIFLMHVLLVSYIMPKVVYHLLPWALGRQIVYQPILIISGVGAPYLFMSLVAKSRFRRAYRYLFG